MVIFNPLQETNSATAFQQLLCSPRLPMYAQQLQSLLQAERQKREQFYEEMSEQQKVEFINGEVVVQSPARLKHTITPDQVKFPAPDLAVEVLSPSTEANDRGVKLIDYAAHGVAEYWIVDPDAEMVEQYILQGENYHLHVKTDSGELQCRVIGGLYIPVRAAFDTDAKLAAVQAILESE